MKNNLLGENATRQCCFVKKNKTIHKSEQDSSEMNWEVKGSTNIASSYENIQKKMIYTNRRRHVLSSLFSNSEWSFKFHNLPSLRDLKVENSTRYLNTPCHYLNVCGEPFVWNEIHPQASKEEIRKTESFNNSKS